MKLLKFFLIIILLGLLILLIFNTYRVHTEFSSKSSQNSDVFYIEEDYREILIADETYIINGMKIGYTHNEEIANILIKQGCTITYIESGKIWFSFDKIPNIL